MQFFFPLFLIIFGTSTALAQATVATSVDGETKKDSEGKVVKKKRLGVDQSDFMPAENTFGFIAGYQVLLDTQEEVEKKTVTNQLSLALTYSFSQTLSSYASIGVVHQTVDNRIYRENDSDQFHNLSNVNLGVVHTEMKPIPYIIRSSNTLNLALPTSEESQIDNQVLEVFYTNFAQSYTWNRFSLFNRFLADYLWNQAKYSITTDLINRDWIISDSIGITYLATNWFGVRASVRTDFQRDISGSWVQGFGSNYSLFANLSGFQLYASYVNNSYPENERVDIFYYDKYKQLYALGVTYAF